MTYTLKKFEYDQLEAVYHQAEGQKIEWWQLYEKLSELLEGAT
jgi:hypothetical protein